MHCTVHLAITQIEPGIRGKAEDAALPLEAGLAEQPVGQQRLAQGYWRGKTSGGADQHMEVGPTRLGAPQELRHTGQSKPGLLHGGPEFGRPHAAFTAEHVFRRGQVAEQTLDGRFE
ncbi:hypothetical protein D3C81_1709300 [compost metagenome]